MRVSLFALPIGLSVFGVAWFLLVVPDMVNGTWWAGLSPFGKWFVYNIGLFLIITGLFGALVSIILTHRLSVVQMLINGFAGFIVFSFVLDMYQPPFAVDQGGAFIIAGGATLIEASVDYMTANAWGALGITGPAIYYLTYVVTPILAIAAAILLFGLNRFAALFAEAM